jgi:hypothetical protein
MPVFTSKLLGVLTIASGQVNGVPLKHNEAFEDAVSLIIYARNATDGVLTYKIQVSPDDGTTWFDLEDSAAAVIAAPNVNGKARHYTPSLNNWWGAATQMRLVASAVTTGIRTWDVTKQFLTS